MTHTHCWHDDYESALSRSSGYGPDRFTLVPLWEYYAVCCFCGDEQMRFKSGELDAHGPHRESFVTHGRREFAQKKA